MKREVAELEKQTAVQDKIIQEFEAKQAKRKRPQPTSNSSAGI